MIQVAGCVPRAHLHWQAVVVIPRAHLHWQAVAVIMPVPSAVVVRFGKYLPLLAAGKPWVEAACWHHREMASACHLNLVSRSQALDWRQKGLVMASCVADDRPWEHYLPTLCHQAQGHGRFLLMEAAQCLRQHLTQFLC